MDHEGRASVAKIFSYPKGEQMKTRNTCAVVAALMSLAASAIQIEVDFTNETGVIRRINGIQNSLPLSSSRGGAYKDILKPLEPPRTHLHDDALLNPGYALVDVSRIFPLFHLDADDPRNYNFKPTDDYIRPLIEAGIEIDFRLGEAIEHSDNLYRVHPPADFEKWADICSHIIRHYNEGWADGFKWNIRYWSIWEEPDTNPTLLAGPDPFYGAYFQLYKTVAPILKRRFPSIRISGPQCATFPQHVKDFVAFCAKEKLPLDALGWTHYPLRPEDLFDLAKEYRAVLDANGYTDTELNIVEWHYGPVSWSGHGTRKTKEHAAEWVRHLNSSDSGAFTAASLILMQDSPVSMMHFYALKSSNFGLFDSSMQPQIHYCAMLAFAQLAHGKVRVATPVNPKDGWYSLASREADGTGHLLVARFKAKYTSRLKVKVAGGGRPVRVRLLDITNPLEEITGWEWDAEQSLLKLPNSICEGAVWLVDFQP